MGPSCASATGSERKDRATVFSRNHRQHHAYQGLSVIVRLRVHGGWSRTGQHGEDCDAFLIRIRQSFQLDCGVYQ